MRNDETRNDDDERELDKYETIMMHDNDENNDNKKDDNDRKR